MKISEKTNHNFFENNNDQPKEHEGTPITLTHQKKTTRELGVIRCSYERKRTFRNPEES